jgi:hypothetical protein
MPRYSVTFFVVILMLCFGIFFGIELATRGMANIQGPAPGYAQQGQGGLVAQQGQTSASGGQTANAGAAQQSGTSAGAGGKAMPQAGNAAGSQATAPPVRPQQPQPQPIAADSGINRVGNQIGDMLQSAAHGTIRTIVSLLDSIVN